MPRVLNKYKDVIPADAVYVGRPSKWGNPFAIGDDGTRKEVVRRYREYVLSQPALMSSIREELRGKNLVCFCKPRACHGDVLLEIANQNSIFEG